MTLLAEANHVYSKDDNNFKSLLYDVEVLYIHFLLYHKHPKHFFQVITEDS